MTDVDELFVLLPVNPAGKGTAKPMPHRDSGQGQEKVLGKKNGIGISTLPFRRLQMPSTPGFQS
jgi:hypothetical protein